VLGAHFWLPKAHVEANTTGSIVLAGLLLKLGSYGVARIFIITILTIFYFNLSGFWLLLRVFSSILTLIQSDFKKLVAYRRVTHMTFLVTGLTAGNKTMLLIVLILSLAHGSCSIGIFYRAGAMSHIRQSRLGVLINSNRSINWMTIMLGGSLIINASVPPIPSFFSEVALVISVRLFNAQCLPLVVILSFIVCYYNSYVILWATHTKSVAPFAIDFNALEGQISIYLFFRGLVSVTWLIVLLSQLSNLKLLIKFGLEL
jgi:NADH-ubiquinone oxidoreductase chain 4